MREPALADDLTARPAYLPLVVVAAAVCAGVVAGRYLPIGATQWFAAATLVWFTWLLAWRGRRERLGCVLLLAALAATGAAWHECRWSLFASDELGAFATNDPQPSAIRAVALASPRRVPAPKFDPLRAFNSGDRSRLLVRVLEIRAGDEWIPASGRATLTVDGHLLDVAAGDELQIFAQLSDIRAPMNPGEFDFAEYARAERRLCLLSTDFPQCVTRVARGSPWTLSRMIDSARVAGQRVLSEDLRSGQALGLALLLGERQRLDPEETREFFEAGSVHILSISGMHVAILALALFWVYRMGLVRRRLALAAIALVVIGYALVIDAEAPAVRATVTVLALCLALAHGRPLSTFNVLAGAALVVVAMNPADLFRAGPQLSFLAMGALAWIGPRLPRGYIADPLDRLIARTRPWPIRALRWLRRWFANTVLLSAGVWLVTLPLVLWQFHLVSPVALVLTPVLAVPIFLALLSGFLLLVLGWLIWPLSALVAWLCDFCMWLVQTTVSLADRAPGGHFWAAGPAAWWVVGFYALLIGLLVARKRPPPRWIAGIAAAWIAVGFFAAQFNGPARGDLECTFLSVGHGCAVVLELPDGGTLLYDAGQLGSPDAAARSISGYLWSRGRTKIDAVVISHADVDHYNALPELLRRFSVGAVYVSPVMFEETSAATTALRSAIEGAGVPMFVLSTGDRLRGAADRMGDCKIEVLHPPARGTLGSDNSNSVVLNVEYAGKRLLLPGDLESPGLDELLAENPMDCDLLLAPHHGSLQSDPPGFADWTSPDYVVISGDRRSNRPEVYDAYTERGAQVLNTSRAGAVSATISKDGVRVRTQRDIESSAL